MWSANAGTNIHTSTTDRLFLKGEIAKRIDNSLMNHPVGIIKSCVRNRRDINARNLGPTVSCSGGCGRELIGHIKNFIERFSSQRANSGGVAIWTY